jgi:glycosyltransferase involved in cell wall biosynthesis
MARPIASVIISARNEAARLEECIASLAGQKTKIPYEVHLVDNNSTDGTLALARRLVAGRKNFFVWRERKPGSPAARNQGARRAKGKVLLFTDADCRLSPHWVEEMTKPFLSTCPYPLAALGGVTESAFQDNIPNLWERYLHELFTFWENDRLSTFPAFLPWAPTCNLAVRADLFHAVQGFDERWRSAAYDVDLCWRLVLCGFVIGHAPRAKLSHRRRHTLRGLLRQMENYAYYNQSLLSTYQRELKLPVLGARKERLLSRGRRLAGALRSTSSLADAGFRGIDGLVALATLKGGLEAKFAGVKASPRFSASRRGQLRKAALPRGYSHLHRQGWVYWKSPADVGVDGDLILYKPRTSERFRLNETAWKVWEVKSEKGQSEDAAEALGQSKFDKEVLRDIDLLTLELRTRRLLP